MKLQSVLRLVPIVQREGSKLNYCNGSQIIRKELPNCQQPSTFGPEVMISSFAEINYVFVSINKGMTKMLLIDQ